MTAPTLPRPTRSGDGLVRTFEVRPGVYRVTVEYAATGQLADELCHSYPRPEQATRAHDMAVTLLATHTVNQVVDLLAVFQTPPARTTPGCGPASTLPPCEEMS